MDFGFFNRAQVTQGIGIAPGACGEPGAVSEAWRNHGAVKPIAPRGLCESLYRYQARPIVKNISFKTEGIGDQIFQNTAQQLSIKNSSALRHIEITGKPHFGILKQRHYDRVCGIFAGKQPGRNFDR